MAIPDASLIMASPAKRQRRFPHAVRIETTEFGRHAALGRWCQESIGTEANSPTDHNGRWYRRGLTQVLRSYGHAYVYVWAGSYEFSREEDAALFKLTWG